MEKSLPRGPVAVVRAIIGNGRGQVLLIRRSEASYVPGVWCLPGGKVEYGESMEQAVRREVKEETGLSCTSCRFLFCQDSLPFEPGGMHCLNLYFEVAVEGEPCATGEAIEFAWVSCGDLGNYQIGFRNCEGLLRYFEHRA